MGQTIQTGQTTVTGSVTTTIASQAGNALTPKAKATQNGAGSATIHTTTVAKVCRIYGASLEYRYGAGGSTAEITANGVPILLAGCHTSGANSVAVNFGNNYIQIAAGQTVALTITGGGNACGTVQLIEVDA